MREQPNTGVSMQRAGDRTDPAAWEPLPERSEHTEHRHAEQARLLELSRDAIIVRDPHDRVTYWSRGAEDLYGYSRREALGRVTHELLATKPALPIPEIRAICEREGAWSGELTHRTKAGHWIVTLSRWVVDRDDHCQVRAILETNSDVTERKRAEQALEHNQERLRESNRELARLTADLEQRVAERTRELSDANAELEAFGHSVAHDLREPLRVMQGFSKALLEDYGPVLPAEGQEFTQRIIAAAERMDRLIVDLLAYARLARTAVSLEALDLRQAFETAVRAIASEPAVRGATVRLVGPPVRLLAQRALLGQVLTNLLVNACKFVPPGLVPEVIVSAERRGECARIWVSDNGIGIASAHHRRIFKVFERLHGQETYAGTGIGLALVRRAVERMRGRVGVESEVGGGSRFWFELPTA
jgi:PAS domain S-box-containing protein